MICMYNIRENNDSHGHYPGEIMVSTAVTWPASLALDHTALLGYRLWWRVRPRLNMFSSLFLTSGLDQQLDDLETLCLDTITTPVVFCHNDLQAGKARTCASAVYLKHCLCALHRGSLPRFFNFLFRARLFRKHYG